jgi:hypothetical protein|eukprot:COSAG06_NODE_2051_length_7730_cov_3.256582_4_plen_134_part_00
MELRDLSPSLGAEVVGLDIAQPLDEATIMQLRRVLHARGLLVVRDSRMTPEQSLDFYRHFLSMPELDGELQGDALGNNDPNLLTAFPSTGGAVQLIGNGSSIEEIGPVTQKEPGFCESSCGSCLPRRMRMCVC